MPDSPAAPTGSRPVGTPDVADLSAVLDGLEVVLQPIVDLATGAAAAYEALARFTHAPAQSTEAVLAAAHAAGYGDDLEAACLRAALRRRDDLPDGVRLAVNLSPDLFGHPALNPIWDADLDGVIVEMTEHAANRTDVLRDEVERLRSRGAAIAIDDVGTGYAGLLRLATMRPEIVKIDKTIVTGLADSVAQRTVLEALVTFAERMGATTIGEGIETLDDLITAADLDLDFGQGWAIGHPAAQVGQIEPHIAAACRRARVESLQRRSARRADTTDTASMHAITLALSGVTGVAELRAAMAGAAREIDVDVIGVSVLCSDGMLREVASTAPLVDPAAYALADFPATRRVIQTGDTVEAHVGDPGVDPAERSLMEVMGLASMLMVALRIEGQAIGVLEFGQFTHRRWTTHDVAHARGLADHLGRALLRVGTEFLVPGARLPLTRLG